MRVPGRDGKTLSDDRKIDNVAIGVIGNLAHWGPSAVSEIQVLTF